MAEPLIEFRSEQSPMVLYACGTCRQLTPPMRVLTKSGGMADDDGRERALSCCVCPTCGHARGKTYTLCDTCRDAAWKAKAATDRAKAMALPAEDATTWADPVYVEDTDTYYEGAREAWEAEVWDRERPADDVLVRPCDVRKQAAPDLAEHVEECWYLDTGLDHSSVSRKASDALAAAQAVLEAERPEVWEPILTRRLALPQEWPPSTIASAEGAE